MTSMQFATRALYTFAAFAFALAEEAAKADEAAGGEEEKKEEEKHDPDHMPSPFNVYTLGSWIFSAAVVFVCYKVAVEAKKQFEEEDHNETVNRISPVDGKKIVDEDDASKKED